ncbi:MAG: 16S rRNA (cytosine(1402)-N(4))-methyltransferase RsmH [Bacteroidales bacterium]|jgi:16S rRNA (cytosine1402-N4)-methyltransferase|nr:16S rRNA (cytosine(1402)-N(4))-methyltransferase RsmH [Bacteroidales bacterium]MDD2687432.1 16S rRNA (cytosine(1402)-N(4))-methyltransferase RsmH [Bacteroidales bacterium]MDD3330644.1 16S rRNA (cytosine(1402)-N(4))-methyltransferase RsmH [Bacteroidales bacterium]MDD3691567.1 16S rRNA (cytosine(1402)-N(4))-methyltransferase RsmH [Bacteroidales bacterium]MDD4045009.1 16S rRNA (cytosine(1402)-N(4))-methyltransferase RsmH [Bacteroidales bacterium]
METLRNTYHKPVLLSESIHGLQIIPDGIYVDVTFGAGGHASAILQHLNEKGRLIAFDQDEDAKHNIPEDTRLTFIHANFRYLKKHLKLHHIEKVNGIFADLGVSSHQFDQAERGFSTRFEAPLDMRMDKRKSLTAAEILASYDLATLVKLFSQYGEIPNAKRLAQRIVDHRKNETITQSKQFIEIIKSCIPKQKEYKYLAQVFQALRIEVNQEMDVLKEFLLQTSDLLAPKGRLLIISYHSLEDRLVKQFMRSGNLEDKLEKDFYGNNLSPFMVINRKAIVPSPAEINENNRSRSAKLRIAEKK